MIRIHQLSLPIQHTREDLEYKLCKLLRIKRGDLLSVQVIRRSIDARKKEDIHYIYTVTCQVSREGAILSHLPASVGEQEKQVAYRLPENGCLKLLHRPVIAGFGPAGMFAALSLARAGLRPLVLERGKTVLQRKESVEFLWKTGVPDPDSNVSFGEGGAGTFSDGKLNTMVKDPVGRNREVLRTFVEFGADPEILTDAHPHIGTDQLIGIVANLRCEILRLGGEVWFDTCLSDLTSENGRLQSVILSDGRKIPCSILILAVGHSARDTFRMLAQKPLLSLEAKPFAVGLRIQHPQKMINGSQYGASAEFLPPAVYKLTGRSGSGRGVYSFCMCPGGYVVDASTEENGRVVNGMSYSDRSSPSANGALIVTVTPEDYAPYGRGPLAGIEFQRYLERQANRFGNGAIPVQLLGDYLYGRETKSYGDVEPCFCGRTAFARLDEAFPSFVKESLQDVIPAWDRRIRGFGREDAILAGVESRTSSPVRIPRNELLESGIHGVYPCGEGAGYAGGITSAAMDGMRVAEEIIRNYERLS